jgi:hypothetical protein
MVNKTSAILGLSAGMAAFLDYLPQMMGALASLVAIVWMCIQAYYFLKEKRKK